MYRYTKQFQKALVEWFNREKRDLPWRHTTDPYKIWVSEVMLQQTRVDTVIPYYENFLEKFPTAEALADANEEFLLKQWEGLGYYSRVRNLQAGVREVVENYGGVVPNTRDEISTLKGVGPYTAGAVLSIAYGVPEHAVDGNVMRVLSRVLLIDEDIALPKTKKTFERAVMELIDYDNPSAFNQGLMELGAMVCTPTSPSCLLCPVRDYCTAFHEGEPEKLPVKTKKVKTKKIPYDVFIVEDAQGRILMEQRPETGLLANMWQFPMVEVKKEVVTDSVMAETYHFELAGKEHLMPLKHVFSHLVWQMDGYVLRAADVEAPPERAAWLTLEEVEKLPLSVSMQKFLAQYRIERQKL